MFKRSLLLAAVALALSGCAVAHDAARPKVALAPAFQRAVAIETGKADADWWRGFDDPLLVTLVNRAIAGNTDLAQARARVEQSRALVRAAGAALLPQLDAAGGVTTLSQSRDTAIGRVTQALETGRGYTEYALGTQASWEIDLFGGLRRGREAARADLASSEASAGALSVAVAAETADAYLTLRAFQARLAVATGQEQNQALLATLVRKRFEQGLAAERDVNRTIAQLEGVRASMASLRAGIAAQANRIDVLVGEAPGSNLALLAEPRPVPAAPMPAGSAAPEDLLRRRPDVVAAEQRLAASHARVGVAIAEYYPRLSLSGLLGVASLGTSNFFTGEAVQASAGAGLRWRLFDFGRIDADVAAARRREAEALEAWRGSVLSAAEDVETGLARLVEAHAERASLEREVASLERAGVQARAAYAGGVADLIEVTDAERELLTASDRLASAKAQESRVAVEVYRALGGGWKPGDTPLLASASGKGS